MNLFSGLRSKIKTDVLLSRYTTFKIGGRADFFVEPYDLEELKKILKVARKQKLKVFLLGCGSNILVSDRGIRGIVIRLNTKYFKNIERRDNILEVGAGLRLSQLLDFCLNNGLSGIEFLAGIPGTVGGAIAMNAGTREGSIGDRLKEVLVMDYNGNIKRLNHKYLKFGYRYSNVRRFIILKAVFELFKKKKSDILSKINYFLNYRRLTQELSYPNAGCIFKNPKGAPAGQLIDACGLKGKSIGRAQISLKHANFIVNKGGATAKDVLRLIDYIQKEIKKKFNINLKLEIKVW